MFTISSVLLKGILFPESFCFLSFRNKWAVAPCEGWQCQKLSEGEELKTPRVTGPRVMSQGNWRKWWVQSVTGFRNMMEDFLEGERRASKVPPSSDFLNQPGCICFEGDRVCLVRNLGSPHPAGRHYTQHGVLSSGKYLHVKYRSSKQSVFPEPL